MRGISIRNQVFLWDEFDVNMCEVKCSDFSVGGNPVYTLVICYPIVPRTYEQGSNMLNYFYFLATESQGTCELFGGLAHLLV